jgi:hypothetical protein
MIGDLQDGTNRAEDRLGRKTFISMYIASFPRTRLSEGWNLDSRDSPEEARASGFGQTSVTEGDYATLREGRRRNPNFRFEANQSGADSPLF